jgi:ribosomal protein L3 glutamine methyltransferase
MNYQQQTKSFNTIIDFLRFAVSECHRANLFYGHGTDNAWDECLILLFHTLSLPHDINKDVLHARLTEQEKTTFLTLLEQRVKENVPVAYLTHEAHFCGLSFYVDDCVLIPRSPISELIENQFTPWIDKTRVRNILDMCTGSGCIAIACSYAFDDAHIDAVDVSKNALVIAQKNCDSLGVSEQLSLIESDLFKQVPVKEYDIIVSNPPYVSSQEMKALPKEFTHEPVIALEAADSGLALVVRLLQNAATYLADEGILIVEVGNSEDALIAKYPQIPFLWLEFERGGSGVFLLTKEQLMASFSKEV